jgi:hypothetical protein
MLALLNIAMTMIRNCPGRSQPAYIEQVYSRADPMFFVIPPYGEADNSVIQGIELAARVALGPYTVAQNGL